ncbi:MAG: hypothetical protein ACJARS_003980 [bacterium]|jgi:hypothetical protein
MPVAEPVDPVVDFALADLHTVVDLALGRGALLLTRGERLVVDQIRALSGQTGAAYARLSNRVTTVWSEDVVPVDVAEELVKRGLLSRLVTWSQRADTLTLPALKQGCRTLGLPVSGKRAHVVERLRGQTHWTDQGFLRLRHPRLILRLERWALLRRRPDRSAFVVGRLGVVRWPDYLPTLGVGLFATRAVWRRWSHRLRVMDGATPEDWLAWLDAGDAPAPGRLSLVRPLTRRLMEAARQLERCREPAAAAVIYERLADGGHVMADGIAARHALALESAGESSAALGVLARALPAARPHHSIGIHRTAKRLSRRLKRGWPPAPPLRPLVERRMRLTQLPSEQARPLWQGQGGATVIEQAVMDAVAQVGRIALSAEGTLWRTLFAVFFADLYFLPVAGALPTPFLTGPLDLGTENFEARRRPQIETLFAAIRAGSSEDLIRDAWRRWHGCALTGAVWSSVTQAQLVAVAKGLGPEPLVAMLAHLLRHGLRSTSGLPDLVVLPGPVARIDGFPSRIPNDLVCVEVKGPTDSLRDGQRVWLDRLVSIGISAEVWHVDPRP